MGSFYHQRPYMGQIAKKPRLGPQRTVTGHGDEEGKRLMSFKEFIINQSDNIDEQQALSSYSVYKTEFIKKQIDKFFKEHDDEEWFRNKYRPVEMNKLEKAKRESKARRKELYSQLIDKEGMDNIILDSQNNQALSVFLDNFSLMLEGATLDEIEKGEARKLYSVSSIFIRNLPPSVDKSQIEEYAKANASFLRVAMSEAQPDKGYRRRVWVTFKQMDPDSLRALTWEFNKQKFLQETNAIVNREMNNRIRYTPWWFCHATAAKNDLKNVAKLLSHFEGEDCPLLNTIKDYLIEETNEEETNLGVNEQNEADFEFTQDPELMKALDKIILYLRVVHSFDYYASTEYIGEDDMPQKVGIMFARPIPPPTVQTYGDCPKQQLLEFIDAQRARVESFLSRPTVSEIEQVQLGKKDAEMSVEDFILQNIDEKKENAKYLCKITQKKFKAMEYVRKHMFNRCKDQIDEVRIKTEFFNNYLADPKRPM